MNVKIGSAPDSWGVWFPDEPTQTPWNRFLDEIAEAGYTWTELGPYGYLPTDLAKLQDELEKRGLKVCSTFAMGNLELASEWSELEEQVMGAGRLLSGLGAEYFILIDGTYSNLFTGQEIESPDLDDESWRWLIDSTHRIARIVSEEFGLKLAFHPHAETHVEYEHQIERLLSDTNPDLVSLCLDIGHHAYRGGDPVTFMRAHHERIPYLHLKSVDPILQKKVTDEQIPFANAVAMDMFCEPSKGLVDFPSFRDLLVEIDYEGFAIVEQDMYPTDFDRPLPIAKRTRQYLMDLGLGS
jgi:inosose dehydratase